VSDQRAALLEPLRSRYLDVLGVDQYVPRAILPAAKPSTMCEWLLAAETAPLTAESKMEAPVIAAPPAHTQAAIPNQAALPDIEVEPPARTAPQRTSAAIKELTTNAAAMPRFALSVTIADGVLLLDDAPTSSAERSEFQKLIGNFLFALRRAPVQFGFDIFLWPMLKSSPVSQDAAAARDALNAYLQKQIQQRQIQRVLILGASAQQWCTLENQPSLHCMRAVSLLQCLREPHYKRQLWNEMRELWNAANTAATE